jgi:DNA helicase-4
MGITLLPRDRLHAAEAEVARTKADLEGACEQARSAKTRTDWLADHPEFARLDRLVAEIPARKEKLARAERDYHLAYTQLLNASLLRTGSPELEKEVTWLRWMHQINPGFAPEKLARLEGTLRDLRRNHESKLRPEIEKELSSLKAQVDEAAKLLAEATNALSCKSDIDQHVAQCIGGFVAEQTRDKQAEWEAAVNVAEETRQWCMAQFRSLLATDFLSARIAEFAPPGHPFRWELEEVKTNFIREWASRHTPEMPDPEQAAAIGAVHDNILVTARAGSGKTRTLVTRAAFLVKHCRVAPDELLLLVFNRAAAEEIRERLKQMGCDVPHAMTFHALAHAIVIPEESILYDSPDDSQPSLSRAFQRVLDGFMDNHRFREDIRAVMLSHFRTDWEKLVLAGLTLSREEGLAFRRALAAETLRGEYVKSFGEKAIANFLFERNVPYTYEKNHWWQGRNYRPDFTIPWGRQGVVIEYFGLAGDPDYDNQAEEKRGYWRGKVDWRLVEVLPADLAKGPGQFEDTLRRRLEACGVPCHRLSEEEIWAQIRDRAITRFATMTRTFVGRCRNVGLTPAALADRIARHQALVEVEATFLRIAAELFSAYLDRLASVGEEDFAGLLERAVGAIESGKTVFDRKSGRGDLSRVRFIMVDEFQDFSPLFFRMLQAARQHNPRMQLFCVGDDWQAINAFAGSDLQYFNRFEDFFPPAIRLPITTNYRSAVRIVEMGNGLMGDQGIQARPGTKVAGQVLIADLAQFEPSTIERESYPGVAITPVVRRILSRELKGGRGVALLARGNYLPYFLGKHATLDTARCLWTQGLTDEEKKRISISTAHKYKGLQAETVVILDAVERRYPLIHPDWVFMRVLGDSVEKLIGDERRLFYVACTRAVKTLIIITENDRDSPFLSGITERCDTLEWQDFPQDTAGHSHWVVKVGSQAGLGSRPTVEVRGDLKAHGFAFFGGREWPYWARTFRSVDNSIQSVVSLLREQDWAKMGKGLEVRICDQNETVSIMYSVDEGNFTTIGAG